MRTSGKFRVAAASQTNFEFDELEKILKSCKFSTLLYHHLSFFSIILYTQTKAHIHSHQSALSFKPYLIFALKAFILS